MRQTNPYLSDGGYDNSNLSVNTAPMGNIMGSQHITNHIRRDRRNNMLNSMMRGTDDIAGVY
jgi:hypothetical protein